MRHQTSAKRQQTNPSAAAQGPACMRLARRAKRVRPFDQERSAPPKENQTNPSAPQARRQGRDAKRTRESPGNQRASSLASDTNEPERPGKQAVRALRETAKRSRAHTAGGPKRTRGARETGGLRGRRWCETNPRAPHRRPVPERARGQRAQAALASRGCQPEAASSRRGPSRPSAEVSSERLSRLCTSRTSSTWRTIAFAPVGA
jgi:hypothetical protein